MRTSPILAALLFSSVVCAQCITPPGAPIAIVQDSINGPHPIGFNFPFAGATYNEIHVSDHGICFLTDNGQPALPAASPLVFTPAAASLVANGPVICPFWSDTIPGLTIIGDVYIDAQGTVCTVTWVDVESFGFPNNQMAFQLKLFDSGNIEFVYGPNVTNNSTYQTSQTGVIGVSPGMPAALPASVDFSTSPVTTDLTTFEEFTTAESFDMGNDSILMQPSPAGWTVIHTPGGTGCASTESFGAGCDGLTLASTMPPLVGNTWELTTTGVDASSPLAVTYFALGRQDPPLPVTTLNYPAPGCDINIPLGSILNQAVAPAVNGTTVVPVNIPAGPAFVGVRLTVQSIAFTAGNAAGFALSNGEEGLIGN